MTTPMKKTGINIMLSDEGTPAKCEMCGKLEELRPYGPNGERVCFDCAMKDEAAMQKKFYERLKGVDVYLIK